ncbi:hypothetical protein A3E39_00215 [Candidatus Uhrbacteria bacterium RIFCSPHIGHO2_12_FULL_60_25]|uniref:Uncharacterized protein n=1 Tax=Candidatus Uhrbacteria bacterium RIFCSPHIGHO2_12_FULL_60_25 TaxID=1802399 RepID=A0A1F7UKP0_9BACT|nr:MAG: hypothetical protein A3D73_00190 [Candidatus Uhrbacteria bacterium RIFCSPHIGHO2_02_FULL_60_44]OGL78839.1 MAG: hypothetical protein A3E39_00215 [Candidatus Uhrbacteria bacterium RIFCSPHIGHO2_12_FULL_60_25]
MKLELHPLQNDACRFGIDPADTRKTDIAFYDWITGKDPSKALARFMVWLLDEFKEEKDQATIRNVLDDWRWSCDADEFQSRVSVLSRLMPDSHPFHAVKNEYTGKP